MRGGFYPIACEDCPSGGRRKMTNRRTMRGGQNLPCEPHCVRPMD